MEEERGEEEIFQVSNGWQPIPSLQAHSSLHQQQQVQLKAQTREWEMVEHRRNEDDDDGDDFSVFPPSNHEGLHILSPQQQQHHHVADVEHYPPQSQPPSSNAHREISIHDHEPPLDSRIDSKKMLMKNLRLGVEVISSNIFGVYYYFKRRRGNWSSSVYLGGFSFTLAMLISFWFFKRNWKQWRRKPREEKLDQLLQLVRHQNQKINQLMDQISYLNELLAGRRRIPILRSD